MPRTESVAWLGWSNDGRKNMAGKIEGGGTAAGARGCATTVRCGTPPTSAVPSHSVSV